MPSKSSCINPILTPPEMYSILLADYGQIVAQTLGGGLILLVVMAYFAFRIMPNAAPWLILIAALTFMVAANDMLELSMAVFGVIDIIALFFVCALIFNGKKGIGTIVALLVGGFTLVAWYQRYLEPYADKPAPRNDLWEDQLEHEREETERINKELRKSEQHLQRYLR